MAQTSPPNSRSTGKKHKLQRHDDDRRKSLLPGLPDHIAEICLSRVQPLYLYDVCKSWRKLIYSPSFPAYLSIYAMFVASKSTDLTDSVFFKEFDPVSCLWRSLPSPSPPSSVPPLRLLIRHPFFISRNLPVQSVSVSGKLVVLAATTDNFAPALPSPLLFDPVSGTWSTAPPLAAPRRWCAAGASENSVYVASGLGAQYSTEVARSVEKLEIGGESKQSNEEFERDWKWKKLGFLKDGKFSREAIEAISCKEKLYMVNVKGDFRKEGVVYDVKNDAWEDMPDGMLAGWRGPAASMAEETIYVVDESKGVLKKYDSERDLWEEIIESEKLQGAEHMAAGGGRVCVVCNNGVDIVVVDVVASPPRLWVVETPAGLQAVAIHVLPRMNWPAISKIVMREVWNSGLGRVPKIKIRLKTPFCSWKSCPMFPDPELENQMELSIQILLAKAARYFDAIDFSFGS